MAEAVAKLGWRKLGSWGLVYLFVFYMSAVAKAEVPPINAGLIQWVTGFFFGANVLEHGADAVKAVFGKGAKEPSK